MSEVVRTYRPDSAEYALLDLLVKAGNGDSAATATLEAQDWTRVGCQNWQEFRAWIWQWAGVPAEVSNNG